MYPYPLADGTWAALVGTSHQELPNPWPQPGGGKWPISHATAPALAGPWTRTNPSGGLPADAPCIDVNGGYTENPIVYRRPDDASRFMAVYDELSDEAHSFGLACSVTGGMDWQRGARVAVPGGCRTPFGLVAMTHEEVVRWAAQIEAYGVINASRVNAVNTTLSWLFYTVSEGGWEVFRAALVQLAW